MKSHAAIGCERMSAKELGCNFWGDWTPVGDESINSDFWISILWREAGSGSFIFVEIVLAAL